MLPIKAIDKIVRHIDLGQSVRWSTCSAACAPLVTRLILLATAPSHLAAAARNFRYFNLAVVVDMLGDLTEIAHVEPLPATGTFHLMIGFGFGDAVSVLARFRHPERL